MAERRGSRKSSAEKGREAVEAARRTQVIKQPQAQVPDEPETALGSPVEPEIIQKPVFDHTYNWQGNGSIRNPRYLTEINRGEMYSRAAFELLERSTTQQRERYMAYVNAIAEAREDMGSIADLEADVVRSLSQDTLYALLYEGLRRFHTYPASKPVAFLEHIPKET